MALLSVLALSAALSSAVLPAYAVSRSVSGSGTGAIHCSNGGGAGGTTIYLTAMKVGKTTTGTFTFPDFGGVGGTIVGAKISPHHFKLEGMVSDSPNICWLVSGQGAGPVEIDGTCGTATTITYTQVTTFGSMLTTATFTGTVTCT